MSVTVAREQPLAPVTVLDKPGSSPDSSRCGRTSTRSSASSATPQWQAATSLPGWNVHDVVAHLIGIESMLQGVDTPEADIDVSTLNHVRNDIGVMNERWVRKLRGSQRRGRCSTTSARRRPSGARR